MSALQRDRDRQRDGRAALGRGPYPLAIAAALLVVGASRASAVGLERMGVIDASGGRAGLLAPAAVWYDGARDLIAVAYPNMQRVALLDRQGTVQKEIGDGEDLRFPRAVAVSRDGTLYVASRESESLAVFGGYAAAVGENARALSLSPYRGRSAVQPTSLFVDENGTLYVADRGNRQILVLGGDGQLRRTIRDVGEPADVWGDRAGNVYVAEPALGGVRVYDGRGKLLRTLGTSPSQFAEPLRPKALVLDRSGRVWVLEEGNRGIKALDAFGNLLFTLPGNALFAPVDLAVDPRDTLYVLEEGGNRLSVFRISEP